MSDNKRIVVAVDKPDLTSALALAKQLDPAMCRLKVGKELFTTAGPAVIDALHQLGFEIFLDLKFHDIPNTVASACKAAANMGVWMVNVHASGGRNMLLAAREAIDTSTNRPLLIAVTVLTSMDDEALADVGVTDPVASQVNRLTTLVDTCGLDGVVCSAQEAASVTAQFPQLLKVTPGIRLATDSSDDQRRVMTPERAVAAGASYLVIGRSVTGAADPAERLQTINRSLSNDIGA